MKQLILYLACSMDGFIARQDGSIDWLDAFSNSNITDDYGYEDFYNSIDEILIGHNTFKQIISFEKEFPYSQKKTYVFSKLPHLSPYPFVKYINENISDFIKDLKQMPGKNIWLVGGSGLNTEMLQCNIIDQIILTYLPISLGTGISIFNKPLNNTIFETVDVKIYSSGVYQVHYKKIIP